MVKRSLLVVGLSAMFVAIGCGLTSGSSQDSGTPSLRTEDVRPAGSSAAGNPNAEIVWLEDFEAAQAQAKPGQVIFVDVYTDWCSWCKHMDKKVFTDPSVRELASKNIFVKIDAEDGGKGQAFAQANGINGYPYLIVYSADGKKLANQPGAFRQAGDFVKWFNSAAVRAA